MEIAEWMISASCATGELFADAWFPETAQGYGSEEARKVCRHCPVWRECREAGKPDQHGIWGGVYKTETTAAKPKIKILDAAGARRRLQALAVLGWASKDVQDDIRRYTGIKVSPKLLDNIRAGIEETLPQPLAEVIDRAYRHMRGVSNSGTSAAATSSHANASGWAGPRAWRGIDIDNPKSEAGHDEFA